MCDFVEKVDLESSGDEFPCSYSADSLVTSMYVLWGIVLFFGVVNTLYILYYYFDRVLYNRIRRSEKNILNNNFNQYADVDASPLKSDSNRSLQQRLSKVVGNPVDPLSAFGRAPVRAMKKQKKWKALDCWGKAQFIRM